MKPKTLVLMVVAVTCGLGASYMTSRLLAERNTDDVKKVAVLVAKRQINTGENIKVPQDLFEEKLYPEGEEPRDAIAKYDDLKGRIMKKALRQGDFIRVDDMLDSKDPQAAFSANLPDGYRAVGQRVSLEAIAGGFASLPHSRVDIIQTVRRGDDKSSYSKIILENVLVLAIDQKTGRDEAGNAMPGGIVTFALSPEDLLKLNLAREVGTLSLALRKFNDNKRSPITELNMEDMKKGTVGGGKTDDPAVASEDLGGTSQGIGGFSLPPLKVEDAKPAVEVKAAEPPPAPVGITRTITITEGDKTRTVTFQIDPVTRRVIQNDVARAEVLARPPQPLEE